MLPVAAPQEDHGAVIQVDGLWCGYPGRTVLRDVSFSIQPAEFVGILGPNGSGKTTLLLALSGIVALQAGQIHLDGTLMEQLGHRQRARRMAVVTQEGEVRLPFSCREVVWMGRYPHQKRWQLETSADSRVVQRAMTLTDTESLADRLITAVSGGEKQRVMMARALAQETAVLLLDEATSAMDIRRKLQVYQVLEQLNHGDGTTVLAVLHDVNLAALFCRRLIFLRDGELIADGPTERVLTPEILETVYGTRVLIQDIATVGRKQVVFIP
ncbi:MAG TPA: iron ABC transporter ATP-binding protein [Syntrophobacteraceae bacterium]|nr:iron ABC transporter ATP-binding protein [Syntrophobacteraceae bacterium]